MDRAVSIAAASDCTPRASGRTKSAFKNMKRDERRARKRAEKASSESIRSEEPFKPPRMSPVGTPVAPGAPLRPSLRPRASLVFADDAAIEALRTALRDSLGAYNRLRAACAACAACSTIAREMEAEPRGGEPLGTADDFVVVSAVEPFYF
jgi:hypothetical protein